MTKKKYAYIFQYIHNTYITERTFFNILMAQDLVGPGEFIAPYFLLFLNWKIVYQMR